jgi:MFS family permease
MGSLLSGALIQFGPHFAKNIAPLKVFFSADPEWHITATEWGLFQTVVTIPIATFPWLLGYSVDKKIPVKLALKWALAMTCIGQSIFVIACKDKMLSTALLGRFCFGIGEGLASSLASYVAIYSSSGSKMFAVGVMQSFHAMAVGLSKAVLAPIARELNSYIGSLIVSLATCFISFVAVSTLRAKLDRSSYQTCESPRSKQLKLCCQGPPGVLSIDFWSVAVLHLLISSSHRLFGHIDAAFLGLKFHRSPEAAGYLSAITEGVAIIVSPLLGYLLDKHRSLLTLPMLILLATVSGSVGYGLLALASRGFSLEIGLFLVGIVNAITPTVMKSVVPETVHDSVLATGLGIYESSESVGVLAGSLMIGFVAARSHDDYSTCIPLFSLLMIMAGVISLTLIQRRFRLHRDLR